MAAVLVTLVAANGAMAQPRGLQDDARRIVLDGIAAPPPGPTREIDISNARTRDIATGEVTISAVCGTIDFRHDDEGRINFLVLYAKDDDGKMITVGQPFIYGPVSGPGGEPRRTAADWFCGPG